MICYLTDRRYANRVAAAIENVTGTPAQVIKDGSSWRISHAGISHEAVDVIHSQLDAGTRSNAITRADVERILAARGL